MDCSNAVKQGMKQRGDVEAAALLDLALDEIAAVNDKEVGKPPFGVGVARISALNRLAVSNFFWSPLALLLPPRRSKRRGAREAAQNRT